MIASFIAVKFLLAGERWNLGTDLPGPLPMTAYGFGIGFTGSLMGVSGGALSSIVLPLYGKPIHNAVATSAGIGVPISIAGALGSLLPYNPIEGYTQHNVLRCPGAATQLAADKSNLVPQPSTIPCLQSERP